VDREVTLTSKGGRWHRTGHPWVYRDDIKEADASLSGEIVRVKASNGQPLGQALFNAQSKIALRWLDSNSERRIDRDFWASRLQAALEYRRRVVQGSTAYRLISSEADGFPGLIVDRYEDALVLQVLSLGIDRNLPLIIEILTESLHPKAVIARNDSPIRSLEGLPQEKEKILGDPPSRMEVSEGECRYLVDVWEGQKTGAYLDQRENRLFAGKHLQGRILDAFSYQGGFSLQVAKRAEEVLAIEDSEAAAAILKENLKLNDIQNVRVEKDNAFDRLKTLEKAGEKFDAVILDPPAFAKSKAQVPSAWAGYREINLRAMRILKSGGLLISCSCSYNIHSEEFLNILWESAIEAGRTARVLESRTQAKDHPILLSHPESKYLKCEILEIL